MKKIILLLLTVIMFVACSKTKDDVLNQTTNTGVKVTFQSNGGTSVAEISTEKNKTISEPKAPTRIGYKFVGWYKEVALTNKWDFVNDKVTQDITLYSKWEIEIFSQEEQDYVNGILNKLSPSAILVKNINGREIHYETERKSSSNTYRMIVDVVKLNSIYKISEITYKNDNPYFERIDYDITLPRIYGEQAESDDFDSAAYDKCSQDLKDNPIENTQFWYDCELVRSEPSMGDRLETYLKIRLWKETGLTAEIINEEIHNYYVYLTSGRYIIADKNGKIAENSSFVNLINNTDVQESLNKVMEANK